MANKKNARRALISSVISLILCCTMFVGTTFAWFTDEVVTGMNTIAAGNLDIELLNNGDKVNSATKLFDDVTLWEPGVVIYENLQVANVGTLALKYQMTLNFGNENDLNGHKLSEVLKIAVIDKVAANATREDVLALAKTAVEADQGNGTLSNFYLTGELEAGETGAEKTFVIFWEPNDNAIDNLYNANNGQTTSDGEPLHIEFGINLQATQLMSEEDSFGNDYDEFASILPKAIVNNTGAKTVPVYMGIDAKEIALDTTFQFLPNESEDDADSSAYKYWHADYVISADKDVPADSIALAGYYEAWCGDNGWVVMTNEDTDITAEDEIRLVELLGATVNYEEICQYGNDGIGFLCGAADLTGENAGTTITVELRLYETTVDPATGTGNKNVETGNYEVVGTYSYTFPAVEVSTMEELDAALKAGAKLIDAKGNNLGDFNYSTNFTDGAVIKNAKLSYMYGGSVEGTVTFENCEFVTESSYSCHFDSGNGKVVFNNCLFDGWNSFGTAITGVEMNNCTFQKSYNYGVLRFYQDAVLKDCTFADSFDRIDTNKDNTRVEFTNCTGFEKKIANNDGHKGIWIIDGKDVSDEIA